jgi:hypothetical protein
MPQYGIEKIKNSWTEERKEKHRKNNPANSEKALQKRKDRNYNRYTFKTLCRKTYSCINNCIHILYLV